MKNNINKKIIELQNVHVNLKNNIESIHIIKGVDLIINENTSVSITGESGAGKSTLAMTIAGLELISKGKILFKNKPIHNLNENDLAIYRSKYVGIIFQSFNLLPSMTAIENINLPNEIAGSYNENKRALELLKLVGLRARINHYPHQLSGGEQQRVAIARALVSFPKILIADEPTGNLDKKNSEEVINLIFKLQKEQGSSLIIVTHDNSIATQCNQTIKLDNGMIV
jgi:putative ABC transport system ATP-binding protein